MAEQTFKESFKVAGSQLIDAFKKLVHEGNVRRVVIKQGDQVIVEFPLTIGVIGTVVAPVLAAIGAIAAMVNECTLEVERVKVRTDEKKDVA
jgi:hypothetical protein